MIAEAGISIVAFVVSFVSLKKGKTKTARAAQEIAEEAKAKAQAYYDKLCKKNGIENTESSNEENKTLIL